MVITRNSIWRFNFQYSISAKQFLPNLPIIVSDIKIQAKIRKGNMKVKNWLVVLFKISPIQIILDQFGKVIINIMNKRILKTTNNKKPLKIVRQHKPTSQSTAILGPNLIQSQNRKLSNSSKKKSLNNKLSSPQNKVASQAKRISLSESKVSQVYEDQALPTSCQNQQIRYGRSQSNFKDFYSIKQRSISQVIYQFIEMLKNRSIVNSHFNSYVIQTNKFSKILAYILLVYNSSDNIQHFSQQLKQQVLLSNFIRKNSYRGSIIQPKLHFRKLLSYHSNLNNHTIFNQRQLSLENSIQELQKEVNRCKKDIHELRNRKEEMILEIGRKNNQCTIINYQIQKLQYDFDQYVKREEFIKDIINNKQGILAQIQLKTQSILSVYQEKGMNEARTVFEQSRRVEDSLFLFANYLKCHPLGEREYEPSKRAHYIERLLQKQSKQLTRLLDLNGDKRQQLICRFIGKYHKEYKSIIAQLQSVIKDKTELINKYTHIVQEWRQNCLQKRKILQNMKDSCLHQAIINERFINNNEFKIKQNQLELSNSDCFKINDNLIKLFQICHPLF